MADHRTPSPHSDTSATPDDRPYAKNDKIGCNATFDFAEKLREQIGIAQLAWDEANKLRAHLDASNGTEAEFLNVVDHV
jgi:hypothetical protein